MDRATHPASGKAGTPTRIDDRLMRAIGIPGFAVAIPYVADLFGPIGPDDVRWWLGAAWFLALSAAIWHGNRWLLYRQRSHWDWFHQPAQKVLVLLSAIVLYTAPLTALALIAWYRAAGLPGDGDAIREVVLINVICVVFVTHIYETVFLIKERELDLVRAERLERARTQAELDALHSQLDPHFLFNSLAALAHLIGADPARAQAFNAQLARVYRYILRSRGRELVPLVDELAFVADYTALLELRFAGGLAVALPTAGDVPADLQVPPISVQALVENAVKHNTVSDREPLAVTVAIRDDQVEVSNPRRPRQRVRPAPGIGLVNLAERCRLVTGRVLDVDAAVDHFTVRVPITRAARA